MPRPSRPSSNSSSAALSAKYAAVRGLDAEPARRVEPGRHHLQRARQIAAQPPDLAEVHVRTRDVLGALERLADAPRLVEVRLGRLELPAVGEHEPEDRPREPFLGLGGGLLRDRERALGAFLRLVPANAQRQRQALVG